MNRGETEIIVFGSIYLKEDSLNYLVALNGLILASSPSVRGFWFVILMLRASSNKPCRQCPYWHNAEISHFICVGKTIMCLFFLFTCCKPVYIFLLLLFVVFVCGFLPYFTLICRLLLKMMFLFYILFYLHILFLIQVSFFSFCFVRHFRLHVWFEIS